MTIEVSDYEEGAFEVGRASMLLQVALRQSEDISGAAASYNRNVNAETRSSLLATASSDAELTHELLFQVFCNLRDIQHEMERLSGIGIATNREGA